MFEQLAATSSSSSDDSKSLMIYHVHYMIYLIATFIAVLSVYHVMFLFAARVPTRFSHRGPLEPESQTIARASGAPHVIDIRRAPTAALGVFRVLLGRVSFSIGGAHFVLGEVLIIAGYFAALLSFEFISGTVFSVRVLCFVLTRITILARDATGALSPSYWANRAGLLVVSQLTFVVALAGKNNIISCMCHFFLKTN